jgi:hypothetical protein
MDLIVGALFYSVNYCPKACLRLINTLFSVRIQGLFGLSYGLFNLGLWVSFEWTSYKST